MAVREDVPDGNNHVPGVLGPYYQLQRELTQIKDRNRGIPSRAPAVEVAAQGILKVANLSEVREAP